MILHFILHGHNGDVHYTKPLMRDLYNIIKPTECFLHCFMNPTLMLDLPFITVKDPLLRKDTKVTDAIPILSDGRNTCDFINFKACGKNFKNVKNTNEYLNQNAIIEDDIYLVTWLSYYWFGADPIPSDKGCSLYSNYEAYKRIYEELGILERLKPIEYYIPTIDFSYFNTKNVDAFFQDNPNPRIFVSNGDVWSGQSNNFNFSPILYKLADQFPNIIFITSHEANINKSNVYYSKNIIKNEGCDLNEIGYIIQNCRINVGRGSGPYCFGHTTKNFFDKNKTMIGFSHTKYDGLWYLPENGCKQVWSDVYDNDHIYETIKQEIQLI